MSKTEKAGGSPSNSGCLGSLRPTECCIRRDMTSSTGLEQREGAASSILHVTNPECFGLALVHLASGQVARNTIAAWMTGEVSDMGLRGVPFKNLSRTTNLGTEPFAPCAPSIHPTASFHMPHRPQFVGRDMGLFGVPFQSLGHTTTHRTELSASPASRMIPTGCFHATHQPRFVVSDMELFGVPIQSLGLMVPTVYFHAPNQPRVDRQNAGSKRIRIHTREPHRSASIVGVDELNPGKSDEPGTVVEHLCALDPPKKSRCGKQTSSGESRLLIHFESYGSMGAVPQRCGSFRQHLIPDGLCGEHTLYDERWRFSLRHSTSEKDKAGHDVVCIVFEIINVSTGQRTRYTETPREALERKKTGRTITGRVFRTAMDARASSLESDMSLSSDPVRLANLRSRAKALRPTRFNLGLLAFGLQHRSVQENIQTGKVSNG